MPIKNILNCIAESLLNSIGYNAIERNAYFIRSYPIILLIMVGFKMKLDTVTPSLGYIT
jgi:hypothetical protein